jgi:creatinine amidohydrolase
VNTGQLDIPLCLNMNPSTQAALLADLVAAIDGAGIRKLLILNGHGGNDFRQMLRELQARSHVFLCTINWYTCVDPKPFFVEPGDHAGELETSVMLHAVPSLVRPLSDAGDGRARRFNVPGLRDGWAWAPRHWRSVTDDTGTGNPKAASAEKGAKYVEAVATRVGQFLVDLAKADPSAMYE